MPKEPPQKSGDPRIKDNGLNILDSGKGNAPKNPLKPLNIKEKPPNAAKARAEAVAVTYDPETGELPRITAAGRGKIAEQILQIAFERGVKVREDAALASMLAKVELDSPIPSEAFLTVAEILSYVYKANGAPNPFDALIDKE